MDAQTASLRAAGADQLFAEKQSGAKTDRGGLARCMASLRAGDLLLVTKLDRLARSTRDLLNTLMSRLNYVKSQELRGSVARRRGFEPLTFAFGGRRPGNALESVEEIIDLCCTLVARTCRQSS